MNEIQEFWYKEFFEKAKEIAIKKGEDYNVGFDMDLYWLYGHKSIIHEIWKKLLRLLSLENKGFGNAENESVKDTLIDLVNYTAFLYIYLKEHGEI